MQATLDSTGLKHLTRALTCLSKFGDELVVVATSETFALSSTNSTLTAYGRFKYPRSFFSKYRIDARPANEDIVELPTVSGQIITKHLLSVLGRKTNEKICEKCEFVITDGPTQSFTFDDEDEERDTLESRLTVRLHCKHGVVKTHRIAFNSTNNHMTPTMPDPIMESRLVVGPKALKNFLDRFPFSRGSKSDPQLVWNFWDDEVQLRSLESAMDGKGRAPLVTEVTISADEFDDYSLQPGSMTIAFHLREFNATIAFAEASQVSLVMRFTDPADPLFVSVDSDSVDSLFVIATTQIQSVSQPNSQTRNSQADSTTNAKGKKRPLEEDNDRRNVGLVQEDRNREVLRERPKKPMKVVHRTDQESIVRQMRPPPLQLQEPQPSWAVLTAAQQQADQYEEYNDQLNDYQAGPSQRSQPSRGTTQDGDTASTRKGREKEPLFLPGSQLSHLPPASQAAIIESGLGIEHMTAEEFEMMLEGDAEEVEFGEDRIKKERDVERGDVEYADGGFWTADDEVDFAVGEESGRQRDSFELVDDDDDVEMAPTQHDGGTRMFRPLFED